MKELLTSCCILFAICFSSLAIEEDEFSQAPQVVLEHELVKGRFTKRGSLAFHSVGVGSAHYTDEGKLSNADKMALMKLAESNDIYRVRAMSKTGQKADYVYGFVYACDLIRNSLSDNVTLALNAHGKLVGVHLTVLDSTICRYEACRLTDEERLDASSLPGQFQTRAAVTRPAAGPMPETQLYVARMEEEKKRKQAAEQGDNRSFFAKYWMYIVPIVVLFMVASNADPNAQGGGGG